MVERSKVEMPPVWDPCLVWTRGRTERITPFKKLIFLSLSLKAPLVMATWYVRDFIFGMSRTTNSLVVI